MYKSQVLRALQMLRMYGSKGCHSFMLSKIIGTNWSPRRIYDLKKKGYNITSKTEKMDGSLGKRYFLHKQKREARRYEFDFINNVCREV